MGSNKKVTSTIFTNADIGKLTLTQILKSLSDPTCLEIVSTLFKENQECSCEIFSDIGKKSKLSQHTLADVEEGDYRFICSSMFNLNFMLKFIYVPS